VPFDRAQRKKEVAQGVALPPESGATYDGKPIPPDYARVDMMWTNLDFDEDEIDIPTEEGYMFIGATIGVRVLWNKSDIVLDMPMPASQPSHPLSSPLGDPGDDDDYDSGDDNDSDDNDNAGGSGTSTLGSPPLGNSNP
jgi:hypothetical protein